MCSYTFTHPFPRGAENCREGLGGAKHVGISLDLLPRERHVHCGQGGGVMVRVMRWGSAVRGPEKWAREAAPLCKIQARRCSGERRWEPGEYLVDPFRSSSTTRGAGLGPSTTPTLRGRDPADQRSTRSPVQLLCFVCLFFLLAQRAPERRKSRVFLVCSIVCMH